MWQIEKVLLWLLLAKNLHPQRIESLSIKSTLARKKWLPLSIESVDFTLLSL